MEGYETDLDSSEETSTYEDERLNFLLLEENKAHPQVLGSIIGGIAKGGVAIAKGAGKVAKAGAKTGAKVAKAGLKTGKKIATYTVKKGVKGAKSVYDSIRKKTKGKKKEKKYFQSPTLKF